MSQIEIDLCNIFILAADPLPPPKPMLFSMLHILFIGNSDWVDGQLISRGSLHNKRGRGKVSVVK